MASLLTQDLASESEDDDFNPAPAEESDNSQSSTTRRVNGTVRDNLGEKGGDQGKRGASINGEGEDGEEEESGDEEDDEEEVNSSRPRKRARRDPRNQYLDVEAEVDDDEDEESEDEDQNFIAADNPDELNDIPDGTEHDDSRHKDLDRQRQRINQMDAEKQAELLREKYGRRQAGGDGAAHVPKRLLLPSVDDPSVFAVRCKPGKEREVIYAITKRMIERQRTRNPMPVTSAFERGGTMSGYLYVEARKQADVLQSLDGIMHVYPRSKIILVPIKEMPDLLRVQKTEALQPGGYVRVKRGKYAGDLAQIDEVETNGLEVSLRIVPRLGYGQEEDSSAPTIDAVKRKRTGPNLATHRPPPRLFSEVEAKKYHSRFLERQSMLDRKHFKYMGETYINGFLIKDFKIQHLVIQDVNPTLEEVTRFTSGADDGTEHLDLSALAATLKKNTTNDSFLPGDVVEIYEGEQSGVSGRAVAVRGDIVTMAVNSGDLAGQKIDVPLKGLRKRFSLGDHVKVIGSSKYQGEVGLVVSIQKDTVTLTKDLTMEEITVFSKDLREASDSGVAGGLGRYDIHDLVQLDPATVGCVIKVDGESMRVLDQNSSVRSILPSQISNKLERRKTAVAVDRNGGEVRCDDTVREYGGESRQGTVIHIHRSFLFLYNREQTENSGITVVRATNVATVAAKGGRVAQATTTGPDLNKMNPAMMRNGAHGAHMAPPKSFGRDRTIGQTVTIRKGAYKGLLGIVRDSNDTTSRIELHTKSKVITVSKDTLSFKNPLTGARMDYNTFVGSRGGRGGSSGGRGDHGGATPSRQPDWSGAGSRTPLPIGGRTPAWGGVAASSSRTPAWSGAASSRTPAWQSGSRTPAYGGNDGSRTVNPYNDGSRTAYGGSGRTPAWNPTATASSYTQDPFNNRTPAWSGSGAANAPTPSASISRAYDAPTPAMDFASAPTPGSSASAAAGGGGGGGSGAGGAAGGAGGVYSAPTPSASGGGGGNAPTPRFSGDAPTPFGGLPETPGFGGGGDDGDAGGPRYEEGTPSP